MDQAVGDHPPSGVRFRDIDAPWRPEMVVMPPDIVRSAARQAYPSDFRATAIGFRVARPVA